MQSVLVELEGAWIDFTAREEIDWAFFILNFNVLVVADEEASLRQFEYVLDVANRADDLARGHVLYVGAAADGRPLNVFQDAAFAQGVAAVQDSRQVGRLASFGIAFAVRGVAQYAVAQIALDQEVFEVLERASDLGRLRLKEALVLLVVEVRCGVGLPLPIRDHKFADIRLLQQVEQTGFKLQELLQLRLRDEALQVILTVSVDILRNTALKCRVHEHFLLALHLRFWSICDGVKLVGLRMLDESLGEQRLLRGQIFRCVQLLG